MSKEDNSKENFAALKDTMAGEEDEETKAVFSKDYMKARDDMVIGPDLENYTPVVHTENMDDVKAATFGPDNDQESIGALSGEYLAGDVSSCHKSADFGNRDAMFDPNDFLVPTNATGYITENPTQNTNESAALGPNVIVNPTSTTLAQVNVLRNPVANQNWKKLANYLRENKYPQDTYSFLALHRPFETKEKTLFFVFGLVPFCFQMMFLLLLVWSETSALTGTIGETDNPESENNGFMGTLASFIPSNALPIMRCTQLVAIGAYVLFPDFSMKDVIRAVQLFPKSSKMKSDDAARTLMFSSLLRGIQGSVAMIASLLLIATTDTVIDIILNFTAINFISNIDDHAFELALSGDFGEALQKESERISKENLPPCVTRREERRKLYQRVVVGLTSLVLFGLIVFVITAQNSANHWVTEILRVQLQEKTGLTEYNGCFVIDRDPSSVFFSRRSYDSFGDSSSDSSFGYCRLDRQWILFKGSEDLDPCDESRSEQVLARSSKTDTYDISSSFELTWYSASNTPLDMYFFGNESEIEEHCNSEIGDGICDLFFNQLGYGYDGGDCCASTCIGSRCGRESPNYNRSIFGGDVSGIHFPTCSDRAMVPITIKLDNISSSRGPEFAIFEYAWEEPWESSTGEAEWRNATPIEPYFSLECAGKNVLTVYIEPSMINKSEKVMVDDGANCILEVRSTTTSNGDIASDDPIWLVDYTLFHGDENDDEIERVPILTQQSREKEVVHFKRIPNSCLHKLGDYVDILSIYTDSNPSNEAIKWLVEVDAENSQCEDEFFLDRFALSTTIFALKGNDALNEEKDQCTWPSIVCRDGQVTQITMQSASLEGHIPTEIELLEKLEILKMPFNQIASIPNFTDSMSHLTELLLSTNQIKSIPSEIGLLTNLKSLELATNQIKSIPSEIGLLTNLKSLELGFNDISLLPTTIESMMSVEKLNLRKNNISSIPSEIGNMTSLKELDFANNRIASIPSEIGILTNLHHVYFHNNEIKSIPSEIGSLLMLETIDLTGNHQITSIPDSIGLLPNLKEFSFEIENLTVIPSEIRFLTDLRDLDMSVDSDRYETLSSGSLVGATVSKNKRNIQSIPDEIEHLVKLEYLTLFGNNITEIPTQIGLLEKLRRIDLTSNDITSIPSEIGSLTNLLRLELAFNQITSIPSEIGKLTKLSRFEVAFNAIGSIPSEIGLLMNFVELDFDYNKIASIPSEVGRMTNLQRLSIANNDIRSIPSQIGSMNNLLNLTLGYNNIASIPTEIGLMKNLTILDLTNNNISSIPTEIGLLTNLEELYMAYNQITSIPTEMGNLKKLEVVNFSGNQIKSIPSELGLLANLSFTILNNDIKDEQIPEEVKSMAGLVSEPGSDWCEIEVEISGCPEYDMSLTNNCVDPFQVATFVYRGKKCDKGSRHGRFCEDFEEGPSSEVGDKAYMLAISDGGSFQHYAGYVEVGQEFILNESQELDMLPSDLVIYIYREKNGGLLQTIALDLSCKYPVFMFDIYGAIEIVSWVERGGRNVDIYLENRNIKSPTWDLRVNVATSSSSNVTITAMNMLWSLEAVPIALPNVGTVLRPGTPMRRLRGLPMTTRTKFSQGYTRIDLFFITVVGEDDAGNECNDNTFLECYNPLG